MVLADLGEDAPLSRAGWDDLGAALKRLHAVEGSQYCWTEDHAFGAVEVPNAPADDWTAFWAERRLCQGLDEIPATLARRVEALAADLPNRLPLRPPPALLHGDLWVGNLVAPGGRFRGFIDPACYFGHCEVDLTMLELFAEVPAAFWEAYGAPDAGYEERRPIYTIWPALVHLRLFGGGYRGLVERCLSDALGPR